MFTLGVANGGADIEFRPGRVVIKELPDWIPLADVVGLGEGMSSIVERLDAMLFVESSFDSVTFVARKRDGGALCLECGDELLESVERVRVLGNPNAATGRALLISFCTRCPSEGSAWSGGAR
jgi:hypothetical protein